MGSINLCTGLLFSMVRCSLASHDFTTGMPTSVQCLPWIGTGTDCELTIHDTIPRMGIFVAQRTLQTPGGVCQAPQIHPECQLSFSFRLLMKNSEGKMRSV